VLKKRSLAGAALDVYEEEEGVFFKDHSDDMIDDDVLARLTTFPNVLITSHQAFLTEEALQQIAQTTLKNIYQWQQGEVLTNQVKSTGKA
jgi:D-lactate dehydrogenase